MKVIISLLVFSVIVLFHEFGHFILAKKNGIGVTEFSLGMGPRLYSTVKGETRYSLKLLPFGGSCMMVGEDGEESGEGSFNNASIWGRISVVAAGPIFNFILAFVFAAIIISVMGYDPSTVIQVAKDSTAAEAGLQEGDVITKLEGHNISIGRDIDTYLLLTGLQDEDITLTYRRDGESKTITYKADSEEKYMLGYTYYPNETAEIMSLSLNMPLQKAGLEVGDTIISVDGTAIADAAALTAYFKEHPLQEKEVNIGYMRDGLKYEANVMPKMKNNISLGFRYNLGREKTNAWGVIKYSAIEVKYWVTTTVKTLGMLFQGKFTVNDLSGPVGIVNTIGDSYEDTKSEGIVVVSMNMLYWAILLSANLGVMNLLPIPALDGGRLLFLFIEAIRKKPLNQNIEGAVHFIGFVFLMALMVFVLFNDVKRLF